MKIIPLLSLLLLLNIFVSAQDFKFGIISEKEINMKRYEKDTSANAVILQEYGESHILSANRNLSFYYHNKIKIFNKQGFDNGDIEILIRKSDANDFEKVSNIEAVTINVNKNGTVIKTKVEKSQIFTENYNKYLDVVKFTFPDLQEGSIIEYSFVLESPFIYNFRRWEFQSHIPTIYSEYLAKIPAVYNYNISLIGNKKLDKQHAVIEKECFTPGGGVKADCSNNTFIMKDIPAFIEEEYMTAASNFVSSLNFELQNLTQSNGVTIQITKEWKHIDYELKTHEYFGKQYTKKSLLNDEIAKVTVNKSTELEKAKAIYKYMQNRIQWDGYHSKYSDEGIKKALNNHTGNVGDINLSLIAALNSAEIEAEPVILSTRENGVVNKLFPVMSEFNYVVCKIEIDEKTYLLDATDPYLPFGLLPLKCINDQGRVMSRSKPSYWIDIKASQKDYKFHQINLQLGDDGKLRGKMELSYSGYEGVNKRRKIKSFASIEEYLEDMEDNLPGFKILKADFENIDDADLSLKEFLEVEIEAYQDLNQEKILFNPYFLNKITANPFRLKERSYPVDWGAPSEANFVVQITFPKNYKIQNVPGKVGAILPANGGRFLSEVSINDSVLKMQQVISFNRSIYQANEYLYLKELFNKIIQTQKFDVVLIKGI